MKSNLDRLKDEIADHLKARSFVIFHGHPRFAEPSPMVHWDTRLYPDYKPFLEVALQLEVRLVTFHHRELAPEFIDDALDDLESAELARDEYQRLSERLRELRIYEGLTSAVELSFVHQGQTFVFTLRAEWYEELLEIADEIDDYISAGEEEPEDEPMGGYFSRN